MEALRGSFRPEFLNRIDDVVIFNPLRKHDIEKIVDIQIKLIEKRLAERHRIKLEIEPRRAHTSPKRVQRRIWRPPLEAIDAEGYP
jgi:ATP-dependent Clp protease ATP-binding subunit ClpA